MNAPRRAGTSDTTAHTGERPGDPHGARLIDVTVLPADRPDLVRPRRRIRRAVTVAAEVVALAAVAVVVTVAAGDTTGDTSPQWTDPTIVASIAVSAHAEVSADASDTRPPRVGWFSVAGYRVPVSATLGPADHADGRARGFARTPAGAVIAAANIAARSAPEAGSRVFGPTIYRQVFDPEGDAFARAVEARYQRARSRTRIPDGDPLFPPSPLTVVGYRIGELNPREPAGVRSLTGVMLRLLLQSPGGGYRDMRLEVRWLYGDWLLYAPPHADWAGVTKTVCPRRGDYVRFQP